LSDVQGSSGLRQDADFLALLHRPSMFPDWAGNVDTLEFAFEKTRNVGKFVAILEADMAQMTSALVARPFVPATKPTPSTPTRNPMTLSPPLMIFAAIGNNRRLTRLAVFV
jgi:hypothetical protein